jgi:hypothetical protein
LRCCLAHEVSCQLLNGRLGSGHHCKLLHHAIVLGVALGFVSRDLLQRHVEDGGICIVQR